MPQAANTVNNFSGGLKTEYTGLNFPENACTETDNCVFDSTGLVTRRAGFDRDNTSDFQSIDHISKAKQIYIWRNAGGQANTDLVVTQVGLLISFWRVYNVNSTNSLTDSILASSFELDNYEIPNSTDTIDHECTFASGNGYLFVFHKNLDPLYCSFDPNAGSVSVTPIILKIRDFSGIFESTPINYRPPALSAQHQYNLQNRGWTSGAAWTTTSTSTVTITTGSKVFTVAGGLSITPGDRVRIVYSVADSIYMSGTVSTYVGTTLTINVTEVSGASLGGASDWIIYEVNASYIDTWFSDLGNYPSNSDVWWKYKDSTDVFDPINTEPSVTINSGYAPSGHYIIEAFNQQRASVASLTGLTSVTTRIRPRIGAWFQGRVWYSGVDASQVATGDQKPYSWSENIYFSQVVESVAQFGDCYQVNDPTSEEFFDLLPTDGGVITIQGAGTIYELFPIQNGLIVRSSNGVYFITGSQGIGFAANDYTPTKISDKTSISSHSVSLEGYPMFWNEEGIQYIHPQPQGPGLIVEDLCEPSIQSFYASIPPVSKKYARGAYNPLERTIKWLYRSTAETSVSDRYFFDGILNFNTTTKSFFPYSLRSPLARIMGLVYITFPGDVTSPNPVIKYFISWETANVAWGEEVDRTNWKDFVSIDGIGDDYTSYFITGYHLAGKGVTKSQSIYVQVFSDADEATAYKIQGIWDYANSGNSGRYSSIQQITNALTRFGIHIRRHKIRGNGFALQLKVTSVDGMPFNIIGWSSLENVNAGI